MQHPPPTRLRSGFVLRWTMLIVVVLAGLSSWALFVTPRVMPATDEPEHLSLEDYFTFVRIQYDSTGGYGESWYRYEGRDWQRWETDHPRAEDNLLFRLQEVTSIEVNPRPIILRLTDERLFDYPFIFMSDVGWQRLSDLEQRRLGEYLDRGGFLWADDFWGEAEWQNFRQNVQAACPSYQWREVRADHPILSSVYQLKECPQIPARTFYEARGLPYDPPGVHRQPVGPESKYTRAHLMGLFDPNDRLVAVATHNTDIADGWEREGEDEEFFTKFSVKSYAMAVNVLFYAFSH